MYINQDKTSTSDCKPSRHGLRHKQSASRFDGTPYYMAPELLKHCNECHYQAEIQAVDCRIASLSFEDVPLASDYAVMNLLLKHDVFYISEVSVDEQFKRWYRIESVFRDQSQRLDKRRLGGHFTALQKFKSYDF
jgi:serine/threonine protein kinase